ncbi:MAG TPA: hypothetical protein VNK82_13600 [Terriglobales bacterium]|nr:hypothetical protein [Terriglobales bacterium]
MARALRLLSVLVLCALAASAQDPKKLKGMPLAVKPAQEEQIGDLAVARAGQKCDNWSWAAGVETLLQRQDVKLGQEFWLLRAYAGTVCVSPLGDAEKLASAINGEYVLDDGRKVRLAARFLPGPPAQADWMILALRRGHPFLLLWRGHAYLVQGVIYDEYIAPTGARLFEIREFRLLDPFAEGDQQRVTFVKGRDDAAELAGTLDVEATFIKPPNWLEPGKQ